MTTLSNKIKKAEANNQISINYAVTEKDGTKLMQLLTTFFVFNVSLDIIYENKDPKQKSIEKC